MPLVKFVFYALCLYWRLSLFFLMLFENYSSYLHCIETVIPSYTLGFLDFIFFFSILLAMLVIISKNPIISVLYLIGLFFNIACYLILIGISFIGLSYLLVYVGAVSILFLFILMLINVRVSELTTESTNSIPLILIIPVLFNFSIQKTLTMTTLSTYNSIFDNNTLLNNIFNMLYIDLKYIYTYLSTDSTLYVTSNMWDSNISATSHIASIGNIMYTNYSIWLIITSIILLLAMVGSIIITIKKE